MGSSYGRLVRQLITESVVLGVLGGAAGLATSHWTIAFGYPALLSRVPLPSAYKDTFTIQLNPDLRIFAFGLAVSIAAGILFGLARRSTERRRAWQMNAAVGILVVAQVRSVVLRVASAIDSGSGSWRGWRPGSRNAVD